MSYTTQQLAEGLANQAKRVANAEESLDRATQNYSTVKRLNGQSGYSVIINGVTIPVASCDTRTYQGTMIRGREMIHLGALKALDGLIDIAKAQVKHERQILAKMAEALAYE